MNARSWRKNLVGGILLICAYHFLLPWVVEGRAVQALLAPAGIESALGAGAAGLVFVLRLVTVFVVPPVMVTLLVLGPRGSEEKSTAADRAVG